MLERVVSCNSTDYLITENNLNVRLIYWRGHQTSPTVVSLKGRLPRKLESKCTLSCEIVQMHSPFRHGFVKKQKSKFNRNRKKTYFLM